MKILFYSARLDEYLKNLEKPTIAKIDRMLGLLEMFGTNLTMPHRRKLQPNLFELRIRGGQEIRIFYSFRNDTAILLHAFIKKTQKLPPGEMQIALNRLKNLKIK